MSKNSVDSVAERLTKYGGMTSDKAHKYAAEVARKKERKDAANGKQEKKTNDKS